MPIDLSNLSAEDVAAATAAVEAARRAHEEKECREVEERRKWQKEEPSVSQYVSFFIFRASLILSVGHGFPRAIRAQSPVSPV
jgi:hypothetical protein